MTYKKGSELFIADYLSRNPSGETLSCEPTIGMVRKSPVEDSRLEEYRELTLTDPELRNLSELWCNGWPETRREVPEGVRVYWPFRDEIHVENGLVMRGDRLVISVQKRREVLAQLHAAHCGVSKMKLRARSALYWPAMSADLENYVGRCHHCAEHRLRSEATWHQTLNEQPIPS